MPPEETHARVIATATKLFHREGFHAVGVDRLTAELGMSKKTLYRHFGSKDELLIEVLDRCDELAVQDFPDENDESTPRERILGIFEAQRDYCSQPDFSGCFFVNIATEIRNPAHPAVRKAGFHKSQLGTYIRRQAALAGAMNSDVLAEQLSVLHTGAADYALLTGEYPPSTVLTVETLLTAHSIC